jgi:two-component system, LytTR family, sensor kinase
MKMKVWLLLTGFAACYFIIHMAYDLPALLNGNSRFARIATSRSMLVSLLADIVISFFYTLIPFLLLYYFYPQQKWLQPILLMVVFLPALFFLHSWIMLFTEKYYRLRHFFNDNLFYLAIYIGYGIAFYFLRYSWFKEMQQKELLLQSRQSELSFLRSQINPHFLFNSLNNIYSLAYQRSERVLPAIAGLSDLLRYMLYDTTEKVPLEKEAEYIRKYIELQKLRFEQPVQASLHISGDIENVFIPPLLLIPFVENAFKHGDFSNGSSGLLMNIYTNDQKLHVHCHNKKGNQQKDSGGGIGLENVKRRLSLLYPGKHILLVEDKNDSFTINLELNYG